MFNHGKPYASLWIIFRVILFTTAYLVGVALIDTEIRPYLESERRFPNITSDVLKLWAVIFILVQALLLTQTTIAFIHELVQSLHDIFSIILRNKSISPKTTLVSQPTAGVDASQLIPQIPPVAKVEPSETAEVPKNAST